MALIVPKANRDSYRRHAAPESIQANLAQARRRAVEAMEEADWLEVLLARRLGQVQAGTWPGCDGTGKNCDHPLRDDAEPVPTHPEEAKP